jgi:exodeoxyribonuclease V alpha subunit
VNKDVDIIVGKVCDVTYISEDKTFGIWTIITGVGMQTITVRNPADDAYGLKLKFFGKYKEHSKYGKQFNAFAYELLPDENSLERAMKFFFPYIGAERARKLREEFGDDIWDVVKNDPLKLATVDGITEERAIELQECFVSRQVGEMVVELMELELSESVIDKMIDAWGQKALELFMLDPYRLVELPRIGFKMADKYALQAGIVKLGDPRRIRAGINHTLMENERSGSTLQEGRSMLLAAADNTRTPIERVRPIATQMKENGEVIVKKLAVSSNTKHHYTSRTVTHMYEQALGDYLLRYVAEGRIRVITGVPGTGKTYAAVEEIKQYAQDYGQYPAVCAPTGKAAQRYSEFPGLDGLSATTIHRLLGVNSKGGFQHNADNWLDDKFVILDEASMVETRLFYSLFDALADNARILIVGDPWQLPSIGPGKVLFDIVQAFPDIVEVKTKVWRSATTIPLHCQSILQGKMPQEDEHLIYMPAETPEEIVNIIQDIQPDVVLSPRSTNHELSSSRFNPVLQAMMNPGGEEFIRWISYSRTKKEKERRAFRIGDPVVQTHNDYTKLVFNGEIGVVTRRDGPSDYIVEYQYPEREIIYANKYKDIDLAYVLSIHKSQGSEWGTVMIILRPDMGQRLLKRDLIYTAVSRTKCKCFVVGSENAFRMAIENKRPSIMNRVTYLPYIIGV